MRFLFLFIIILGTTKWLGAQNSATIQINSKELAELLRSQEGVLLDVRTQREFQNGHIENAGQLNYYALDFKKRLLLLPKDDRIYLYCNTGYRSDRAADFLIENGYTQVYNLQHGIMEWERYDFPVMIDPNAQPDTDDKFDPRDFETLLAQNELVFIDFYAPWCGPCRNMMPMIDSLKVEYHERIPIIKINADASKRLMRQMELISVPYFALFRDGHLVFEHYGIINREKLKGQLDALL